MNEYFICGTKKEKGHTAIEQHQGEGKLNIQISIVAQIYLVVFDKATCIHTQLVKRIGIIVFMLLKEVSVTLYLKTCA